MPTASSSTRRQSVAEGLDVATHVESGDVVDVLTRVADAVAADVIVVGNRRPALMPKFIAGSIADRLTHQAHCDVLVVHTEGAAAQTGNFPKVLAIVSTLALQLQSPPRGTRNPHGNHHRVEAQGPHRQEAVAEALHRQPAPAAMNHDHPPDDSRDAEVRDPRPAPRTGGQAPQVRVPQVRDPRPAPRVLAASLPKFEAPKFEIPAQLQELAAKLPKFEAPKFEIPAQLQELMAKLPRMDLPKYPSSRPAARSRACNPDADPQAGPADATACRRARLLGFLRIDIDIEIAMVA